MFSKFILITFAIQAILPQVYSDSCLVESFDQVPQAIKDCKNITISNLEVPAGKTLKLDLTDDTTVTFKGRISFAYNAPWKGPLVTINGTRVVVQGAPGHVIDGQGQYYWDGHGDSGVPKPNFFTIQTFGGSIFRNINVINAPHDMLQVTNSDDAIYTNWFYNNSAADISVRTKERCGKNTDGFEVWNSTNILIKNSVIINQDDCLALRCGSNITVSNLECHGSHGLSISVGFSNDSMPDNPLNTLTNVLIKNSILFGGSNSGRNGIHIKTHNEGGFGKIENVTYDGITFIDALNNGILIEQNYPNHTQPPRDNVPIKNLTLKNIYGTVIPKAIAVYVMCAENACENWHWTNVTVKGSERNNTCNIKFDGSSICDN